jgi:hypothetical protein
MFEYGGGTTRQFTTSLFYAQLCHIARTLNAWAHTISFLLKRAVRGEFLLAIGAGARYKGIVL